MTSPSTISGAPISVQSRNRPHRVRVRSMASPSIGSMGMSIIRQKPKTAPTAASGTPMLAAK